MNGEMRKIKHVEKKARTMKDGVERLVKAQNEEHKDLKGS